MHHHRVLTHEPTKSLERSWNSDMRIDLDENTLSSVDVDLKQPSFVQWRIKKSEKTLEND